MGGLFSLLSNNNDYDKRREELQEFLAKTQAELDAYNQAYEQNMKSRSEKIAEIYESRKAIIQERIEELIYVDKRYTELKDQRRRVNNRAGAYVCLVLFNYYNQMSIELDANLNECSIIKIFMQAYDDVIFPEKDVEDNKLVFGQLCQISPLLPLIWPDGKDDSSIHEKYSTSSDGSLNSVEFMTTVNGYLKAYVRKNLRKYTYNVCVSNAYERLTTIDEDNDTQAKKFNKYENMCAVYLDEVRECLTNESFVSVTYNFLKQFNTVDDLMRRFLPCSRA